MSNEQAWFEIGKVTGKAEGIIIGMICIGSICAVKYGIKKLRKMKTN